jgi:hypothetical protein
MHVVSETAQLSKIKQEQEAILKRLDVLVTGKKDNTRSTILTRSLFVAKPKPLATY